MKKMVLLVIVVLVIAWWQVDRRCFRDCRGWGYSYDYCEAACGYEAGLK